MQAWNDEIIAAIDEEIPNNPDWDAEQVANHYLGKEGAKVQRALERYAYIRKQVRMK